VFARRHPTISGQAATAAALKPNKLGMRLIAHHQYAVVIRLWVSYTPTDATQRDIGRYGLHVTARAIEPDRKRSGPVVGQRTARAGTGQMGVRCRTTRGGDMSESDMVDHPDVQGLVLKAREDLAAGKDKEAARLLTEAAYHTHDPEIERQVRELANQGLEHAGRFSKGRWEEIIRIADLRAQRA
jgi:hypothetical protein